VALYRTAFARADGNNYAAAFATARQSSDPVLLKVLEWRNLLRNESSFREIAAFLDANPVWPSRSTLQEEAEEAMPADLPARQVVAWFKRYPPQSPTGFLRYLQALRQTNEQKTLRREAVAFWREEPMEAEEEQSFLASYHNLIGRDDQTARLDMLLDGRRWTDAKRQAERIGGGYPAYARARIGLTTGSLSESSALQGVPDSLRSHPALLHERARARLNAGDTAGALALLKAVPKRAGEFDAYWPIRQDIVRRALREGRVELAYQIAATHGSLSGLAFAEGEWHAGWIALRWLKDPSTAYRHFTQLYNGTTTPISRSRGAFWAGEAASALGRTEQANLWYKDAAEFDSTFYGQLATMRLGGYPHLLTLPGPAITAKIRQDFESSDPVRAIRALQQIGRNDLVRLFFASLRAGATNSSDYWMVADLAYQLGLFYEGLRTARLAGLEGYMLSTHLFPMPDIPTDRRTDKAILYAVMRQESLFDSGAQSPVGARGLMQLMPGTAQMMANQVGLPYSLDRLTSDPGYNVQLGAAFLRTMLDRYDGYLPMALAAYNAGPGRVDQWIALYGDPRKADVDAIDWIELIPFDETRNYVQRVLEGYAVYKQRLNPGEDFIAEMPNLLRVSGPPPGVDPQAVQRANK